MLSPRTDAPSVKQFPFADFLLRGGASEHRLNIVTVTEHSRWKRGRVEGGGADGHSKNDLMSWYYCTPY